MNIVYFGTGIILILFGTFLILSAFNNEKAIYTDDDFEEFDRIGIEIEALDSEWDSLFREWKKAMDKLDFKKAEEINNKQREINIKSRELNEQRGKSLKRAKEK